MQGGGGAGGSGTGGTVYEPKNQAAADTSYGTLLSDLYDTAKSGVDAIGATGSPGANAYTQALDEVGTLTDNPYEYQATDSALRAYNQYAYDQYPQAVQNARDLSYASYQGLPYLTKTLEQGFDPAYQQLADDAANDPYRASALAGATDAAAMGQTGATATQGLAADVGSTVSPLIQSAFDPQSALYNRNASRALDRGNAINAMSGLSGTPYGASTLGKTMSDFDLDWQDRQLDRQITGAGAAGTAGEKAGTLYKAAPALAYTSAQYPSDTYQGQLEDSTRGLVARDKAGTEGLKAYGSGLGSIGTGYTSSNTLGSKAGETLGTLGAAPYNASGTIAKNALTGLADTSKLGYTAYNEADDVLTDLEQYMGIGQSASTASGNLQNQDFTQTASGIGGLLSGAGTVADLTMSAPAAGSLAASSDRRLKTDIKRVGTLDNGLPVYLYRYKDGGDLLHLGLMADDVEKVHPEAVVERDDGFKAVYYEQAVL